MLKTYGQAIGAALFVAASSLVSGCALGIAAGAGAVAADEIDEDEECDDNFDPLEGARNKDDGCN